MNRSQMSPIMKALWCIATIIITGCGGGGGGGYVSGVTPLSLLAGNTDGKGSVDGTGTAARFNGPSGVATDSAGNVYVADKGNNTIRKITPAGVVITLAGTAGISEPADGTGAAASFNNPNGIATDSAGNIYVADLGDSTIRKITPAGVVTTLAGTAWVSGSADGTGAAASFNNPNGIATDSAGNLYVADTGNNTIREITPAGVVTTLAGTAGVTGSTDGTGAAASFNGPSGIATDNAGNIYVADSGNRIIRKITSSGVVTTLAGTAGVSGSTDGTGAAASFAIPTGIATDSAGNIYAVDASNNTIREITPSGEVTTLAGTAWVRGSADGTGAAASFNSPNGIVIDSANNLYVADSENNTIREITLAGIVTTQAGTAGVTGSADGTGTAASFNQPRGIAVDSASDVYVADTFNSAIRKITPAGVVTTLAGGTYGHTDGTGAAAKFQYPWGIATDSADNIYVADESDSTIRKITPAGVVTTLAGTAGVTGSDDGTGATASFKYPKAIATDSADNIYVADTYNQTIRKITPAGVVTTLAGTAGNIGHADGTGAAASFAYPTGIATDSAGNVYVADFGNSNIRKITPAGVVTTLAGTNGNIGSADGIGAAASFNGPEGIATDSAGNIYVADTINNTIRKITPAGEVTTVVGQAGIGGFVPGNLPGLLSLPYGVAISGRTLYTTTNNAIVQVTDLP